MRPASADRGPDLAPFADLVSRDHGVAVVALARPDGTVHASVVSAGVLAHPVTAHPRDVTRHVPDRPLVHPSERRPKET